MMSKSIVKLIVFLAFVVLLSAFVLFGDNVNMSQVNVEQFKTRVESYGIWGPAVYIVFFIVGPYLLIPAFVLGMSAGLIWGMKGAIYLMVAGVIASVLEFWAARYWMRELIQKFLKGKLDRFDRALAEKGFLTVLLIRLVPNIVWNFQNLALGLTKVRFRDYFWATVLGISPYVFAFVYFGSSLNDVMVESKNSKVIFTAVGVVVGVLILQMVLRHFRRTRLEKKESLLP